MIGLACLGALTASMFGHADAKNFAPGPALPRPSSSYAMGEYSSRIGEPGRGKRGGPQNNPKRRPPPGLGELKHLYDLRARPPDMVKDQERLERRIDAELDRVRQEPELLRALCDYALRR